MVQAYILVQAEAGTATTLAVRISAIPGVTEAHAVTGPYDVIVRAEARTLGDLTSRVLHTVQQSAGITRTLTCPVVHL